MTRTPNHHTRFGVIFSEPRPSGSGLPRRTRRIASRLCLVALSTCTANAQPRSEHPDERTQDLADRLIRGESANENIMERIIKQMGEVQKRLSAAFDPGAETQRLQQRIIARLDEAIAASIRQGSRGGSSTGAMGDKRRRVPKPADKRSNAGSPPFSGDPEGSASPTKGDPQQTDRAGPLRDSKRGWGNLPPRDRDEVLQGINEKALERFRQWIERYYQALAEKDDQ